MNNHSDIKKLEKEVSRRERALNLLYKKPIAVVAKEFGVTRQTIHNWHKQRNTEGNLIPKKRGGSKKKTISIPEEEIKQIIQTHTPLDLGYKNQLWSIAIVEKMISANYGIDISSYKTKQFLISWKLYPDKRFRRYWISLANRHTDYMALDKYAEKIKRPLYCIDYLENKIDNSICLYAVTPHGRLHFKCIGRKYNENEKVEMNREFLQSLQKMACKKILVVYFVNLTAENLSKWRRSKNGSEIKMLQIHRQSPWNYHPFHSFRT